MADERFSKSKATYFTLDFANVTEKGLKKLIDAFARTKSKVAGVEATNRITKKDGQPTKKAVLRFERGQSVTITVGPLGDVIETRLNATVIPVVPKAMENVAAYAKEMSAKLIANQGRFDKSQAAKLKRVTDTSGKKPAGRTLASRLIEAQSANNAATANLTATQQRMTALQGESAGVKSELEDAKRKLEAERATTNQLIEQIENKKRAA